MTILKEIKREVDHVQGRETNKFRMIAKAYRKELGKTPMNEVYNLCEELLKTKNRSTTIIAYQILFDQKKRFNENTIDIFENYLYKYIEDWWDCDDFMTHAFQHVLMKYPQHLSRIKHWVTHERFAVRRSAAVVLIVPAKKKLIKKELIFEVCDLLKNDTHYLVQKGFWWLLKVSSKEYHNAVISYLEENVNQLSRVAFRYALENLEEDEKQAMMHL